MSGDWRRNHLGQFMKKEKRQTKTLDGESVLDSLTEQEEAEQAESQTSSALRFRPPPKPGKAFVHSLGEKIEEKKDFLAKKSEKRKEKGSAQSDKLDQDVPSSVSPLGKRSHAAKEENVPSNPLSTSRKSARELHAAGEAIPEENVVADGANGVNEIHDEGHSVDAVHHEDRYCSNSHADGTNNSDGVDSPLFHSPGRHSHSHAEPVVRTTIPHSHSEPKLLHSPVIPHTFEKKGLVQGITDKIEKKKVKKKEREERNAEENEDGEINEHPSNDIEKFHPAKAFQGIADKFEQKKKKQKEKEDREREEREQQERINVTPVNEVEHPRDKLKKQRGDEGTPGPIKWLKHHERDSSGPLFKQLVNHVADKRIHKMKAVRKDVHHSQPKKVGTVSMSLKQAKVPGAHSIQVKAFWRGGELCSSASLRVKGGSFDVPSTYCSGTFDLYDPTYDYVLLLVYDSTGLVPNIIGRVLLPLYNLFSLNNGPVGTDYWIDILPIPGVNSYGPLDMIVGAVKGVPQSGMKRPSPALGSVLVQIQINLTTPFLSTYFLPTTRYADKGDMIPKDEEDDEDSGPNVNPVHLKRNLDRLKQALGLPYLLTPPFSLLLIPFMYLCCFMCSPAAVPLALFLLLVAGGLIAYSRKSFKHIILWEDQVGKSEMLSVWNLREKLLGLKQGVETLQLYTGEAATQLERGQNLWNWTDPRLSAIAYSFLFLVAIILSLFIALFGVPILAFILVTVPVLASNLFIRFEKPADFLESVHNQQELNQVSNSSSSAPPDDVPNDSAAEANESITIGSTEIHFGWLKRLRAQEKITNFLSHVPDALDTENRFCCDLITTPVVGHSSSGNGNLTGSSITSSTGSSRGKTD